MTSWDTERALVNPDNLGRTDAAAIARLLEVTRSITGVLDLDRLLQRILNSAVEVVGAERGYLILLDPDETLPTEQRLRVKAAYRMDLDEILEVKFRASRTAILRVLETGSAHHSDNALAEPDPSRSVELFGLRSIICQPLLARERLLGALYVDSRVTARFSPGARDILPSLASQAAICIENATLVAEREDALRREHTEHIHATEMETWKNAMAAFVSVASHDLKGPLTVIANGLSLLRRIGLPEDAREVVDDMQISLQRARRLVETYLDASALQEGRGLALDIASVGLRELVDSELAFVLAGPGSPRFELVNSVPEECRVQADRDRLQQIVGNLIENALKYAGKGRIEVRAEEVGDEVKVEISDQGPGIAPELQPRLFDRYFRGEGSVARGTGLGLWIVRQLVESMEGRIELESQPGQGSTFRFYLPAAV